MNRFMAAIVIIMAGIIMALPVMAADNTIKLGVVDFQKIMKESKAIKDTQASLIKEITARKDTLTTAQGKVSKIDEEFKKDGAKMSAQVKKEKEEKLSKAIKELNRLKSEITMEFSKKTTELKQKIAGDIRQAAQKLANRERYTLILDKQSTLFASDVFDVTDKII